MLLALNGKIRVLLVSVLLPEIVVSAVIKMALESGAAERVLSSNTSPPANTNGPEPSPNVAVAFSEMVPAALVVGPL